MNYSNFRISLHITVAVLSLILIFYFLFENFQIIDVLLENFQTSSTRALILGYSISLIIFLFYISLKRPDFIRIFFGLDSKNQINLEIYDQISHIKTRLREIESTKNTNITIKDKNEIEKKLIQSMQGSITQKITDKIKKDIGGEVNKEAKLNLLTKVFQDNVDRLSRERQTITIWTLLNPIAGTVTAGFGAYLLYSAVVALSLDGEVKFDTLIFSFTARLSLVIIIQLFAYFFLNLYRTGLQEIKFYQNEISNTLSKMAGVQIAILSEDKALTMEITKSLMQTERNFILKKGEATIALEQNKTDRDADNHLVNVVTDAVKTALPKSGITTSRGRAKKTS